MLSVTGEAGQLGTADFGHVGHQIFQRGQIVVEERQDIVYREALSAGRAVGIGTGPRRGPGGDDEWA